MDDTSKANGEVISRRRRWSGPKIALIVIAALASLSVLGLAGISYAGYKYSEKYDGKILPGVTIAGVDVGGLDRAAALSEVKESIRPALKRTVDVSFKGKTWTVTPKELGARSNARKVVEAALQASSETSFVQKTRMRLFDEELSFAGHVAIRYPRRGITGFVEGIASGYDRDPVDSGIDYSTGWVKITPSETGRTVEVGASARTLRRTLIEGGSTSDLRVSIEKPEVTEADFGQVLLVRIGENKLYLYEDGKITHSWTVATGQPAYPTPTGLFEVTEKRYLPTWINPQPDTWGKDLPAEIPPGPGNPLGLRALNWSASGIRFHGTEALYSLGYNASHGCVRMSNPDVIQLYDMVDVGTPIVSVVAAALRPQYVESPDPTPVPDGDAKKRD